MGYISKIGKGFLMVSFGYTLESSLFSTMGKVIGVFLHVTRGLRIYVLAIGGLVILIDFMWGRIGKS